MRIKTLTTYDWCCLSFSASITWVMLRPIRALINDLVGSGYLGLWIVLIQLNMNTIHAISQNRILILVCAIELRQVKRLPSLSIGKLSGLCSCFWHSCCWYHWSRRCVCVLDFLHQCCQWGNNVCIDPQLAQRAVIYAWCRREAPATTHPTAIAPRETKLTALDATKLTPPPNQH
jgi:hypothetical protein